MLLWINILYDMFGVMSWSGESCLQRIGDLLSKGLCVTVITFCLPKIPSEVSVGNGILHILLLCSGGMCCQTVALGKHRCSVKCKQP